MGSLVSDILPRLVVRSDACSQCLIDVLFSIKASGAECLIFLQVQHSISLGAGGCDEKLFFPFGVPNS